MTIAFTIGAYRLCDFIHLALKQIQRLSPDSHILVSDDAAPESGFIQKMTEEHGATYRGSTKRRGHFASDLQCLVNSLSFAEAAKADVAVKVSQRFIFRKPEALQAIVAAFSNPEILVATPGQPKAVNGFGSFTTLSDIVAIRVGAITPTELLQMYRERLLREKGVPHGSFLECLVDEFHHSRFPGRTLKLPELTNHSGMDPIYLRRYQNSEQQYRDLAMTHGFTGHFPVVEWGQIEGRMYLCKPVVV